MSRILSIFLSVLVFTQGLNIGVDDFSKLDVLINHFQYHQKQYGEGFFDFLVEHYGLENQDQQPFHKDHENLPFKHLDCSHISNFIALQPEVAFIKNPEIKFGKPVFFYKELGSLFEKAPIFQPPKFS